MMDPMGHFFHVNAGKKYGRMESKTKYKRKVKNSKTSIDFSRHPLLTRSVKRIETRFV